MTPSPAIFEKSKHKIEFAPTQQQQKKKKTYNDKDDLKDGTSFVSSPIGITKKGTNKREDVNSSSPFADIVSSISIVLLQNSCKK